MDVVGSITGFFRSILWAIIYLLLWVTDTIWQGEGKHLTWLTDTSLEHAHLSLFVH